MLRRLFTAPTLKTALPPLLPTSQLGYGYISKKALDEIGKDYGEGAWNQTKMYTRQAKLIMTEGMKAFRRDMGKYIEMRRRLGNEGTQTTEQDQRLMKKLQGEMRRMKTMVIIQILPFSGPILLYYLYTYPTEIPTWFCIDQIYENYQRECMRKQLQRVQEFRLHPLDGKDFTVEGVETERLKRISELLYGHYDDGVVGINKMFKGQQREYMVHPKFSRHLVKRTLRKEFKIETKGHPELEAMSLDELILWKYDRVMNQGERLTFVPALEHESEEGQEKDEQKRTSERVDVKQVKTSPQSQSQVLNDSPPQQMSQPVTNQFSNKKSPSDK